MDRRLFLALPWLLAGCKPASPAFRNTELNKPAFGKRLALQDHEGQMRSLADFSGKVIILFFGYTSCPDICPTMLARLAEVMNKLGTMAKRVQVLFVTLDPERDSAARLKDFVPWFHPSFLGLRGSTEETRRVAEEFRVFSVRKEVGSELGYILDHSAGAYLFDPAGQLRLYVGDQAGVDDIVADIRLLLAG
jgi:protein SCO1/2